MSEHQTVAFRAIDGPVSEKNLEYMEKQSSRAEITPWSFDNEYHYGDFRGDALEMLRRGYDIHLHYANFGVRKLMIRLPHGLPNTHAAKAYLEEDSLTLFQDRHGGATLCIEPFYEPGDLDDIWEIDEIIGGLIPLRAEIMNGDLRPLYLAHLAVARDGNHDPEQQCEGPVPAGLGKLTKAQRELAKLYELNDSLLAAAAVGSPPPPAQPDVAQQHLQWLKSQPEAQKNAWLADWMAGSGSRVRAEILQQFRQAQPGLEWPTVRLNRTISELESAAEALQYAADSKTAAAAARARAKHLASITDDPSIALKKVEKLVKERSHHAYSQAAQLLADVRDALAGSDRAGLAEQQAQRLRKDNPTLRGFLPMLREHGLIKK